MHQRALIHQRQVSDLPLWDMDNPSCLSRTTLAKALGAKTGILIRSEPSWKQRSLPIRGRILALEAHEADDIDEGV